MNNIDDVILGLKCCRDWENLYEVLPECKNCQFKDDGKMSCVDMKQQIDAAIELIIQQQTHIEALHMFIRELKKAVEGYANGT